MYLRQAMGIYISNYRDRLDISYILYHPQKPLITTRTAKYLYTDILPSGENAIVAIMVYTGYNQEDSLVVNLSALDRGLFRSTNLKKHIAAIQKNQSTSQDDVFMKPDPTKVTGMRHGSYDKLNDRGFVPEEVKIDNGDVIIGKVSPIQPVGNSNKTFKDNSEIYKSHAPAVIDKVYTNIYNSDGYEMRKIRTRSERKPRSGDKFCCYSHDHEVLTNMGWIPFDKLTKEYYVASLINNDTLVYVKPKEIQSYDYEGQMYVVDSNQVKLKVTPNHRMYVGDKLENNFKILLAENIYGKRMKYIKNVQNYKNNVHNNISNNLILKNNIITSFKVPAYNNLPDLLLNIDSWLIIFGIWMAKGCTHNYNVCFNVHKKRVKNNLKEHCKKLSLEILKKKEKSTDTEFNRWSIKDRRIYEYLKDLNLGAVNKYLPDWVWNLNMYQCRILINGMMLGDGHIMENGTERYDTSSLKLANDFQRLCLHAGWSTNIIIKYKAGHTSIIKKEDRKGEIIKSTSDAYRMTIIKSQNTPLINKNIKKNGENRNDRYENYKGKVYCCTVEGDGIIYVRRNGYPVWCGNSRHKFCV